MNNKRILLLDDQETNLDYIYNSILKGTESIYTIVPTSTLKKAKDEAFLSKKTNNPFHYFLVDISLGDGNGKDLHKGGIEAIEEIIKIIGGIKTIAYSGKFSHHIEMEVRKAGAYRYLYGRDLKKIMHETLEQLDALVEIEDNVEELKRGKNPT